MDKIQQCLSNKAVTEPGVQLCSSVVPFREKSVVRQANSLLREALAWQGESGFSLSEFPDLEGVFAALDKPDAVLDIEAFWGLQQVFINAGKAREMADKADAQRFPEFSSFCRNCTWPGKLAAAVGRCLDPSGNIKDGSSPALKNVRSEIRNLRSQCTRKVQDAIQEGGLSQYLQDDYLTISSDRYVLALKANFKGRVQGIIHDYSQTGETCYFEPMFLMDMNNKLQGLKQEEKEEINKILQYLTSLCLQEREKLRGLYDWAVQLDFLLAKCALAREINGIPLDVGNESRLDLRNARHPLLAFRQDFVQPVDISLESGQRVLIISGGNSGGKTVALKTLGLCACMVSCGLPVPVDEGSQLPFWDEVFVSMGDEQSLEENLSTFTAQIEHLRDFWPEIGPSSLVILDEFGAGTSPSQGAALAQAVVDELVDKNAWVMAATHFPALKAYGLTRERVRAASVLFDPRDKKPLYRLAYDQVGASQALDVAREQGLPEDILQRAEEYLLVDGNEGQVFERLNSLALDREREIEDLKRRREKLEGQYERKLQELEEEKAKLFEEVRGQSREILERWKEQKIGRKKALRELAHLKSRTGAKEEAAESGSSWEDIQVGASYLYLPWNKKGMVQDKEGKKGQVKLDLGGVVMWVAPSELQVTGGQQPGKDKGTNTTLSSAPERGVTLRLDIRGTRVEEGLASLEKYLDRALLDGRRELAVVHGKGTGALKQAVQDYLRDMPQIEDFGPAPEDQGGEGVTLVQLR